VKRFPYIWLPRTGQTTLRTAGDDGDYEAGKPGVIANRFITVKTGVMLDRDTGLMWPSDIGGEGAPWNGTRSWTDGLSDIATLNGSSYKGYADWRMPNRLEGMLLMDHENGGFYSGGPAVVASGLYWTSTTRPNDTTRAYYIDNDGRLTTYDSAKTDLRYVIPCRGGRIND